MDVQFSYDQSTTTNAVAISTTAFGTIFCVAVSDVTTREQIVERVTREFRRAARCSVDLEEVREALELVVRLAREAVSARARIGTLWHESDRIAADALLAGINH